MYANVRKKWPKTKRIILYESCEFERAYLYYVEIESGSYSVLILHCIYILYVFKEILPDVK